MLLKGLLGFMALACLATAGASNALAVGGLVGDCVDCHTMHNSQQGAPVAKAGLNSTASVTPNPTLLKLDCIACHAQNTGSKIVTMPGGSTIPQVYHTDSTDLAADNFKHIADNGERKGHNVVDLVTADSTFSRPPGYRNHDSLGFEFNVDKLTCAGNMGCHGLRGQQLDEGDIESGIAATYRSGLTALSGYDGPTAGNTSYVRGAHHTSYDGLKTDGSNPDFYQNTLAHSYRFIRGLKGSGNVVDRWQNVDSVSHNEYAGGYVNDTIKNTNYESALCTRCHFSNNSQTARLYTPNSTMTGFCITCHGSFHSSGVTNGTSGAFLRHPSDYVIPDRDEYSAYTLYDVSALVARPVAAFVPGFTPSSTVNPGTDLVMCLSCHVAHASPYDGMLRFDYSAMTAGGYLDHAAAATAGGCLACHTSKGVLPENR
jgi:hypothetical protein